MIGNLITDGTRVAVGTLGYVVIFDLSAYEVQSIQQVQMQNGTTLSDPCVTPTERDALFALCEDATSTTDFAYLLDGQSLYVFCRTASYPYTSASSVGFWLLRNAIDMAATTDTIDVAQDKENLFRLLVLESMYINKNLKVPVNITNGISKEKALFSLT